MIKTLLYILFFGLCIILAIVLAIDANGKKKGVKDFSKKSLSKKAQIGIVGGFVGSFALAMLVPPSFHQVEAGQVAVVKSLGKVVGTRNPGTHFDFALTHEYTVFDTTVQKLDISTSSYSSDAQTMDIQITLQYKINPDKAAEILTEYTSMASLERRIEKVADDNTKSILSKYTAMKIIETRASISPEVEEVIKNTVGDKYYVQVTAVNLTNIQFTPEFEKAVEDKVVAEQQKEAAITKAEQELEVAKLIAQAKIEEARGDAESQKIIAAAEAEASAIKIVNLAKSLGFTVNETYIQKVNTLVSKDGATVSESTLENEVYVKEEGVEVIPNADGSITTITKTIESTKYAIQYDADHTAEDLKIVVEYVKYLEYLSKWNGVLPTVVAGEDALSIIIPNN